MRPRLRIPTPALVLVPLLAALLAPHAEAIQFRKGDLRANLDITLSYGLTFRADQRDSALIGVQNGGTANSINGDNGNLNYQNGDIVSNNLRASFEIDAAFRDFYAFSRFFTFYDFQVMDGNTRRTVLSDEARDRVGRDIRLLDLYGGWSRFWSGGFFDVRAGNMVLNWGESTFIQGGMNSINPVDVGKLRTAGSEIKDALTAVPRVDAKIGLGSRFSLEGFYEFLWQDTVLDPEGTFFSNSDFAGPGGKYVFLNFGRAFPQGPTDDPPLLGANAAVIRSADREAKDSGQFGAALRWFEPSLSDAEFGFYYTRTHARIPLVSGRTGTLAGAASGDYAGSAAYYFEFPEDIDTYGFSVSTEFSPTATALAGEVSYRPNLPLQVDDVELLFAALSPLGLVNPAAGIFGQYGQLGQYGFEEDISGWRRKKALQAQLTATQIFGPGLGADQTVLVVEAGFNQIYDMEDKSVLRYDAGGTYTSGTDIFTQAGIQPATEPGGFADPFAWGYRALLRPTILNAFWNINLTPSVAWLHDVNGTTPLPITNFKEGRKTLTLGMTAEFLLAWQLDFVYTNSWGGGSYNTRNDRDYFSTSLSYSF